MIGVGPSFGVPVTLVDRLLGVFGECRAALEGLERCTGNPADHVHTLRKRGKRLRGGLVVLAAPNRVLHELRDIGRILGASRDAAVRQATLRCLREAPGESFQEDAALGVVEALLAEEASFAGGTPAVAVLAFLADRLAGVEAWMRELPPGLDADPVVESVGQLNARALKRLERIAHKGARAPHFHEARKAVKRLHGALWFLRPEGVEPTSKTLRRLAALGDDLGGINDLDVLASWLNGAGLTAARLPGLHRAVARRRRRLAGRVARRARLLTASLAAVVDQPVAP